MDGWVNGGTIDANTNAYACLLADMAVLYLTMILPSSLCIL